MRGTIRPAALVATYFDNLPPEARGTAQALHRLVLAAAPELEQTVKWGNLVFQWQGQHVMAIVAHKAHANLQFFNGAELAAAYPQLEGTGKGLRHLKCRFSQPVDDALVQELVRETLRTPP
jgi:hypothetical protein